MSECGLGILEPEPTQLQCNRHRRRHQPNHAQYFRYCYREGPIRPPNVSSTHAFVYLTPGMLALTHSLTHSRIHTCAHEPRILVCTRAHYLLVFFFEYQHTRARADLFTATMTRLQAVAWHGPGQEEHGDGTQRIRRTEAPRARGCSVV